VDVLGVDARIIQQNSVVSEPVATAMAQAARKLFNADYAVATTGNAGPDKGDSDVEVGTVFIGIATPYKSYALEFMMGNNRERVVGKTINKSIDLIISELMSESK
jgi:nicotinamide-nucleotide amidase